MRTASVLMPRSTSQRIERPRHAAGGVLVEGDRLEQVAAADHRAADHVGVAAQVLGRAVHDEIGAQLERPLKIGGGERVVHRQDAPRRWASSAIGGDVDDLQAADWSASRSRPAWWPA